ncbi:MAG: hypothetical protein K0Q71_4678 [Thermomicrobiales bacterium]|jgi:uncharacterized protein (TIGR02271 family)|nr:hypothetical protein [Thermomicrobiales bacterium]
MGVLENAETSDGMCADLAANDELRIPLAREEFTATARPIRGGTVRIAKRVVTEDQVLEVPVTEEEIRVERRIIERPGGANGPEAFEQIVIEVPLYRDRLDVQKRTRVSDEIIVTKELTQRIEQVRDTVRREEIFVDGDAALIDDVDSGLPHQS